MWYHRWKNFSEKTDLNVAGFIFTVLKCTMKINPITVLDLSEPEGFLL
jgi:hypothetical protein